MSQKCMGNAGEVYILKYIVKKNTMAYTFFLNNSLTQELLAPFQTWAKVIV